MEALARSFFPPFGQRDQARDQILRVMGLETRMDGMDGMILE
jgi:hypothetical protein